MSQWTYVTGCIKLSMSPYIKDTNSNGEDTLILKYPKEQCKIIEHYHYYDNEPTWVTMEVSSFPIAKRVIKPLIERIIPQGEDKLTYFLNQKEKDCDDCRNFFVSDSEEKMYEELCKKKFGNKYNSKDYQLDVIQVNGSFTLTIANDIRDCSGAELYEAFIELFKAFDAANIYIDSCAIEWKDEWCGNTLFKITQVCPGEEIVFEVRDIRKNKIEKFDVFKYDRNSKLVKKECCSVKDLLKGGKK